MNHCINRIHGKPWCGKITLGQWHFVDEQHVSDTIAYGSAKHPCQKCIQEIERSKKS